MGCGKDSVVNYLSYSTFDKFIIAEPISSFLEGAVTNKSNKITSLNCRIEDIPKFNYKIDFVIISSLLHEVDDPLRVLKTIYKLVDKETIVHINVPNAESFHRILAKEMGIISSVFEMSATQILLQQSHTYNYESLTKLIELSGFVVIDKGSYFIKPFTHKQMQLMLDNKIINTNVLEGLDRMIKYFPDMGSEIYLNVRKKNGS